MSCDLVDPVAEAAFQSFVLDHSAQTWKRPVLELVQAVILLAALQSFPHLHGVQVLLQGSFAQHTEVFDSDGDFVVATYDRTGLSSSSQYVAHAMTRAERRNLKAAIDKQLQVDTGAWTVLDSAILVNAINYKLEHHPAAAAGLGPGGQRAAPQAERHVISFDIVADKTRFSRSAGGSSGGSAGVLSTMLAMRQEPAATSAIKAIKVMMRKCPHLFPRVSGTHVEALVLERLHHHRQGAGPGGADPGGLSLLLLVLRQFQQGGSQGRELEGAELDRRMRDFMPFHFGIFMPQGDIECWQNSAQNLLRRQPRLATAEDCSAWLLRGALPPATPGPAAAPRPASAPTAGSSSSSSSNAWCTIM